MQAYVSAVERVGELDKVARAGGEALLVLRDGLRAVKVHFLGNDSLGLNDDRGIRVTNAAEGSVLSWLRDETRVNSQDGEVGERRCLACPGEGVVRRSN